MTYYPERDQRDHYRRGAWDRGCTCPMLPPHVHLVECPLYVVPGGTPTGFHDHAGEGSRGGEDRRPTGPTLVVDAPSPAYLEHLDQSHDADEGRPWL